jgi:HEAT repeat protein
VCDVPFQRFSRRAVGLAAALALLATACGESVQGTIAKAEDATLSASERCNAIYGLSGEGEPAVAPLLALTDDPDAEVAECARKAIAYVDDADAADALVGLLGDDNPAVVASALEALGHIGDRSTARRVARALDSSNPGVVLAAARALGRIGDPGVVPALEKAALRRGANPAEDRAGRKARRLVVVALGDLGGPEVKSTLVQVLSSDPSSSRAAGTALAKIFAEDVTPLLPLLQDKRNVDLAFGLVDVGQPGTEGALVTALMRYGGGDLAKYYLNSGNGALEDAGRKWAHEHGYSVITIPGIGEDGDTWGSGP